MQKFTYLFAVLFFSSLISCLKPEADTYRKAGKEKEGEENEAEDFKGALDYWRSKTLDVDLGYVPQAKLIAAINEGKRRLKEKANSRSVNGNLADLVWRERGPANVGGRTRAIMIDKANHNRVWVGGVSGGLWRTDDVTKADPEFVKLADYLNNISIGAIAQDPNNLGTIYVGTGEGYPNADAITGTGMFKTTDDGETWDWVASTQAPAFANIYEVYVHTNGDIYVCTQNGGILRSKDGAQTWDKVLGAGLSGSSSNTFYDFKFIEANQTFFASNDNSIFKSTTGDRGDWVNIGTTQPGFPNNLQRVEFDVCPTSPEVIYCVGNINSLSSNVFESQDGGATWQTRAIPPIMSDNYGQGWYDLDIAVDPFNCLHIIAGGISLAESFNQGLTWQPLFGIHSDEHNITFDPTDIGRILFGCDGGFWMSENNGQTIVDKSINYVTTQFYGCAIHPAAASPYIMGGAQDNGTHAIKDPGLSPSDHVTGADGMLCFIDQVDPNFQISSSQNGGWNLSTDGGNNFSGGLVSVNGDWVDWSDYDSRNHILYGQVRPSGTEEIDFFRWKVTESGGTELNLVDIAGINVNVTAVLVDPNVPNRVYFGGQGGQVFRVDDADLNATSVGGTKFADLPGNASISCIYMDKPTSNDALITLNNYGSNLKNVWVSYTGGQDWASIEGDLPDLPVYWAVFDPGNHHRAMIATEAGVWTTEFIDGDSTKWTPTNPANGMPFIRVTMFKMRDNDKVVVASTYGRGLMTTDIFSAPAAVIVSQPVIYLGQSAVIDGSGSVNAQSYQWDFGDFTTSTDAKVNHTYTAPGTYTITLVINGNSATSITKKISVLPYLPAPYQSGDTDWGGDFENHTEQFAAYSDRGTTFSRGVSDKAGKDGTHSGSNAWVLGIHDALYQNNTIASLYTPMYDFSAPGLYDLRFWTKFAIEYIYDGFQIEYTLDGGLTWQQLGSKDDPGWYNYRNSNVTDGAFVQGKSYFCNAQLNWTQYIKDVSFLAGKDKVAFRFLFKSSTSEQAQGLAIDDFEVTKYTGELKTSITAFSADYTGDQEVTLRWTTGIEYQCQKFYIERSFTGLGFSEDASVNAVGVISTFPHNYTKTDQTLQSVIYYRLRVVNDNPALDYHEEFYTPTVIVRRGVDPDLVQNVLTNPFDDQIFVSFSSIVSKTVTARLFDLSGKMVVEDITNPNGISYVMKDLHLPQGIYVLSIQIGDGETKAYKLFTLGY